MYHSKVSNSHHFDEKCNFYYVKGAIFNVQKVKEYARVRKNGKYCSVRIELLYHLVINLSCGKVRKKIYCTF